MSISKVFVARLANTPAFDQNGDRVGRVRDVIINYRSSQSPRVNGILIELAGASRRVIFAAMNEITSIGSSQLIVDWERVDRHSFEQRGEEVRVFSDLLDRSAIVLASGTRGVVEDVAIQQADDGTWSVEQLFLRMPRTTMHMFGRQPSKYVTWDEVELDLDPTVDTPATQFLTAHSEMGPSDFADALLELPEERRLEVVEEMPDERIAAVLEEMYEDDQVVIIDHLGDERAADVLDQMQPDDAADLVGRLDDEKSEALLALMEPEEAEDVRMLLEFEPNTAGGLMTTDPIIVSADTTVAEALVLIRRQEIPPALATTVFVTASPYETPTGRYLGLVHFQRLLRYPPHERVGSILDSDTQPVPTTATDIDVVRSLARYDLVVLPVVDDDNCLVGAISVDDVLDHILPNDWRSVPREVTLDTQALTLPRKPLIGQLDHQQNRG